MMPFITDLTKETFKKPCLISVMHIQTQAANARGEGSIPGLGIKILHVMWHRQKEKEAAAMVIFKHKS